MNFKVNISDDAELRNYLKQQIREAVNGVGREDYLEMLKAEVQRKVALMSPSETMRMYRLAIKDIAGERNWSIVPELQAALAAKVDVEFDKINVEKIVHNRAINALSKFFSTSE